jgi:hypothetical protein
MRGRFFKEPGLPYNTQRTGARRRIVRLAHICHTQRDVPDSIPSTRR